MSDEEVWKDIPGTNGGYQASNLGRIRRVRPRILKPSMWRGYPRVGLWDGERKHSRHVHLLVMQTFIGPKPLGYVTNHKNGHKSDARLENLEYVTRSENNRHAFVMGLARPLRGEDAPWAKLTTEKATAIRKRSQAGELNTTLATEFGVCPSTISKVIAGRHWGPSTDKASDLAKRGGRARQQQRRKDVRCRNGHFYTTRSDSVRFCRVCRRKTNRIYQRVRRYAARRQA